MLVVGFEADLCQLVQRVDGTARRYPKRTSRGITSPANVDLITCASGIADAQEARRQVIGSLPATARPRRGGQVIEVGERELQTPGGRRAGLMFSAPIEIASRCRTASSHRRSSGSRTGPELRVDLLAVGGDLGADVAEGAAVAGQAEADVELVDDIERVEELAGRVGGVAVVEEERRCVRAGGLRRRAGRSRARGGRRGRARGRASRRRGRSRGRSRRRRRRRARGRAGRRDRCRGSRRGGPRSVRAPRPGRRCDGRPRSGRSSARSGSSAIARCAPTPGASRARSRRRRRSRRRQP